jgi:hypothetical protein
LEFVLEPLRTLDFVRFQEPVLDRSLNLKKGFQNRFLRNLNFENCSRTNSLEPYISKKGSRIGSLEPHILKRVPVWQKLEPVLELLRTLDFVVFQESVLDGTLNFKKRSRTGSP